MKQKHKKILGILGLIMVVTVTVFAASLPAPKTQASSSVTDEITVRVVSGDASIKINEVGARTDRSDELNIDIDYEKITNLTVDLTYSNGEKEEKIQLADITTEQSAIGELPISFNLKNRTYSYNGMTYYFPDYFGYGDYLIHAYEDTGTGTDAIVQDYFSFKYTADDGIVVPNTGTITEQKTNLMQTDYLITGLIVFLLIGISGFMFISGKEKSTRKRRK